MSSATDVLIIGGGILGTSIAFNLAKRGVRVTLVERKFIASGPTGRSSAIIRQHYSNVVTARMALRSLRIWQNFDDVVGGTADFKETGFMLGARPEDLDGLKANLALQQSIGINTRFVAVADIRELEPHLSTDGIVGAAYEPEAGYADPAAAATAFAAAARRLGATIVQDTPVLAIRTDGDRVTGVATSQGDLAAGAVVVAAGPWTPYLLKSVGIDLPITASRVQVCFYRWPAGFQGHRIYADLIGQVYLRPEGGRQMLVGSIAPKEAEDHIEDLEHVNEQADYHTVSQFAEVISHRYPEMQRGFAAGGYASVYDITPDWNPILDEVPAIRGLYCCAGGSGHCFKLGPAIGEMVAALVVEGRHPDDDINLFSFDRFTRGRLIKSRYEYNIIG